MSIVKKREIGGTSGEYALEVYAAGGSANPFVFKGTVTTATDATHFASTDLIGYGNDALKDWYIYVFYDTAGTDAAPQGEQQPISDYVSSTGTFTHTAFTADLAVDDEVFIMHPYEATGGDATEAKQDTIITDVGRQVSMMEFWGDIDDIITLTTATTNENLPNVIVADVPSGATITRVIGMVRMRALNNTNAGVNAINGAGIIRVKKSTGAWATDDVDLINIPDNIWSTAASTKEGGMLIEGDNDAVSEVDGNATYNIRFNGNIFVDGNNLELIDAGAGLKVYFTA